MKEVLRDESLVNKLGGQDANELSKEEAHLLGYDRSLQSLREYDPVDADPEDHVVELADRRSVRLGDLLEDESAPYSVRADAQATLDEKYAQRDLAVAQEPPLAGRRNKGSKSSSSNSSSSSSNSGSSSSGTSSSGSSSSSS